MIFSAERIYDLIRFITFFAFELLFLFLSALNAEKADREHLSRGKLEKPSFIKTPLLRVISIRHCYGTNLHNSSG